MTRDEAINLLDNLLGMVEDNHGSDYDMAIHMAIDALSQPERKTGKWIRETKHYKDSEQEFCYYEERCSECGTKRKIGWAEVRYCPMCGARLVQEGEDNDG